MGETEGGPASSVTNSTGVENEAKNYGRAELVFS